MFDKQIRLQMECNFKLIRAVGHHLNVFLGFFITQTMASRVTHLSAISNKTHI